ncbi:MAG: aminotransferase class V-fold PLP-dependent enzyme, partial [Candidatus Aminicenantaceae bacterium]
MQFDLESIREHILGRDLLIPTPFGDRHLLYADFTASGRGLLFIENIMLELQKSYANTHTEDDYTGKFTTRILHRAEEKIKRMVNAGPEGKVIPIGSGTTGALKKLQEIIGVSMPPVTRERYEEAIRKAAGNPSKIFEELERRKPVVFIGPYEHHTNELMWREAFTEVVVVGFNPSGLLDLEDLETKLAASDLAQRSKIVSISAGSNITGIRTPVYDVARIGHAHEALVFFDFAAVAPYIEIDMNRDKNSYFDAIFFSPHKFLGGPGSSGILVFNQRIYRQDLPPTTAGGGTVAFVGYDQHDFSEDIEAREKAGTPPILQTIKAALAMEVKDRIGVDRIEEIEAEYTSYFHERLLKMKYIEPIGNADPKDCLSIVSFNITHLDRILHPKFITKLINDLFGIQSRAGCSCAGPYGHALLGIDAQASQRIRDSVRKGYGGLKPGWVRVNLHYTLTREDLDFLLDAIEFVAQKGHLFLPLYVFDLKTSEWSHRDFPDVGRRLDLEQDYSSRSVDLSRLPELRKAVLSQAKQLAEELNADPKS